MNGNPKPYSYPADSDLFLAIGTFSTTRTSSNCYTAYDHYDFTPDKASNVPYAGLWALQLAGAREFDVHSSGTLP